MPRSTISDVMGIVKLVGDLLPYDEWSDGESQELLSESERETVYVCGGTEESANDWCAMI